MSYIIAVNASIVSDSGGTCVCPREESDPLCMADEAYLLCVADIKRDMVTATAAISALASFFMGLLANMPVALAPGMGLNAYFAYTVRLPLVLLISLRFLTTSFRSLASTVAAKFPSKSPSPPFSSKVSSFSVSLSSVSASGLRAPSPDPSNSPRARVSVSSSHSSDSRTLKVLVSSSVLPRRLLSLPAARPSSRVPTAPTQEHAQTRPRCATPSCGSVCSAVVS